MTVDKPWKVTIPSGQMGTYEHEQDALDVVDLIRHSHSAECELSHFTDGQWVVVDVPGES